MELSGAATLDDAGYAILPFLDPSDAVELRSGFAELGPIPGDGCVGKASSISGDSDAYRAAAEQLVHDAVRERLAALFPDHRLVAAGFTVTWPGEFSGTGLHAGSGSVDGSELNCVTVSIALLDTQRITGEDWVVPGSHMWAPADRLDLSDVAERVATRHSRRVELSAGEALVAAGPLLRFSRQNETDHPRVTADLVLAPVDADDHTPERAIRRLTQDDLDRLVEAGEAEASPPEIYAGPNSTVSWCRRCGASGYDDRVRDAWTGRRWELCPTCTTQPLPAWSPSGDPAAQAVSDGVPDEVDDLTPLPENDVPFLRDRALDARLRHDGWVRMPLIPRDVAAELREEFFALNGETGHGFHNDFHVRDQSYRRRAKELMSSVLDEPIRERVEGYEPFMHTFLTKWPGRDSYFTVHRDWMFVDERQGHRAFIVFVALEDVLGHNGQVRMLRGSHRIDGTMRGTNLWTPWLRHDEVIEPRLETVPISAGDCAIWNTSIVHSSYPNHTPTPRVAVGVWMKPIGAPVSHFKRLDDRTTAVYHAPGFYDHGHPYSVMVSHPSFELVDVVPTNAVDVSPEHLADVLDRAAAPPTYGLARRVGASLKQAGSSVYRRFGAA